MSHVTLVKTKVHVNIISTAGAGEISSPTISSASFRYKEYFVIQHYIKVNVDNIVNRHNADNNRKQQVHTRIYFTIKAQFHYCVCLCTQKLRALAAQSFCLATCPVAPVTRYRREATFRCWYWYLSADIPQSLPRLKWLEFLITSNF